MLEYMGKLYYITGLSGTGKSTVLKELLKRGYNAHGVDEEGFANWHDKASSKVVDFPHNQKDIDMHAWFAKHDWILDVNKVASLKNLYADEEPIFLCGSAMHEDKAWSLFNKAFSLMVDLDTARSRIQQRTDNQFGQLAEEWESVAQWHSTYKDDYTKLGAIFIDATQPVGKVIDNILALT
jgi:thymidylate kinase